MKESIYLESYWKAKLDVAKTESEIDNISQKLEIKLKTKKEYLKSKEKELIRDLGQSNLFSGTLEKDDRFPQYLYSYELMKRQMYDISINKCWGLKNVPKTEYDELLILSLNCSMNELGFDNLKSNGEFDLVVGYGKGLKFNRKTNKVKYIEIDHNSGDDADGKQLEIAENATKHIVETMIKNGFVMGEKNENN